MTQHQISGLLIGLLGLVVFFITPYQVGSVQSGAFPRIISVCLVLFGILVVVGSAQQGKQNGVKLFDPLLLGYLALVFAAIVCIRLIGFYPAILLSLPICLVLFGERNYKKISIFTITTTGTVYLIIDIILGARLP